MRNLPRPVPLDCLEEARNNDEEGPWGDIDRTCRRKVRVSLLENQDNYCVWCERHINVQNCHTDHIVPQVQDPSKRRDIINLAASCNTKGTCGRCKGGKNMDLALHLNPYEEPNLAGLFTFLPNGDIKPSSEDAQGKAKYMIALCGLASPKLTLLRKNIATAILNQLDAIRESENKDAVRKAIMCNPKHFPTLHKQLLS